MRISDWSSDVCSSDLLIERDLAMRDVFFDRDHQLDDVDRFEAEIGKQLGIARHRRFVFAIPVLRELIEQGGQLLQQLIAGGGHKASGVKRMGDNFVSATATFER